jgi:hypothetical protein
MIVRCGKFTAACCTLAVKITWVSSLARYAADSIRGLPSTTPSPMSWMLPPCFDASSTTHACSS